MHILGFAYIQIRVLSIHAKMVVTVRAMALEDTVVNVLRELVEKTAQKVHKLVYFYRFPCLSLSIQFILVQFRSQVQVS